VERRVVAAAAAPAIATMLTNETAPTALFIVAPHRLAVCAKVYSPSRMRVVDDGMARGAGIACATMSSAADRETGRSKTRCSGPFFDLDHEVEMRDAAEVLLQVSD
jgi:hypothetical protein